MQIRTPVVKLNGGLNFWIKIDFENNAGNPGMAGFYREFMAALHMGLGEDMGKDTAIIALSYIGMCAFSSTVYIFSVLVPLIWILKIKVRYSHLNTKLFGFGSR